VGRGLIGRAINACYPMRRKDRDMPARLELRHLGKTFGHTRVLSDVHLSVEPGEIHALVGQNGSGKSTVIKVIAGYHAPDRGAELLVDGEPVHLPVRPGSLAASGISIVHQNPGLVEHLSVAENISIGQEKRSRWTRKLNRRREAIAAGEILSRLHVSLDPSTLVKDLVPEERANVAIARALCSQIPGRGVIILDEATRALSRDSAAAFYKTLRHAVSEGGSVLVVAHSLSEVMAIADRVTVIRDGEIVGDGLPAGDLSEQAIARLMLGRTVEQIVSVKQLPAEVPHIAVRGLDTGHDRCLDFDIRRNEIVGLTGSAGAGWEQVPYLLAGDARARAGVIDVGGVTIDLARASLRHLLKAGVVLVPERRELQGLAVGLSVTENVSLPRMRRNSRPWFSGLRWQRDEATRIIATLGVQPPDPDLPVGKLSGGNQQKVLLGKWLLGGPELLILHEPTQGVDVAARQDLLNAVVSAARSGTSVLLVSNDVNDLSAVCRRVLVVHDGAITEELIGPTPDHIVDAVYEGRPTVGSSA